MQQKRLPSRNISSFKNNFKNLISSFDTKGYDKSCPILVDENYRLIDGSHRLACSLYFSCDLVTIEIRERFDDVDYSLLWFKENRFSKKELFLIENKMKKML